MPLWRVRGRDPEDGRIVEFYVTDPNMAQNVAPNFTEVSVEGVPAVPGTPREEFRQEYLGAFQEPMNRVFMPTGPSELEAAVMRELQESVRETLADNIDIRSLRPRGVPIDRLDAMADADMIRATYDRVYGLAAAQVAGNHTNERLFPAQWVETTRPFRVDRGSWVADLQAGERYALEGDWYDTRLAGVSGLIVRWRGSLLYLSWDEIDANCHLLDMGGTRCGRPAGYCGRCRTTVGCQNRHVREEPDRHWLELQTLIHREQNDEPRELRFTVLKNRSVEADGATFKFDPDRVIRFEKPKEPSTRFDREDVV